MKTAKETTIDYLESIRKEKLNTLMNLSLLGSTEGSILCNDIDILKDAIDIVKESEEV